MRTYSTPQSALDGEITRLAILECIASVAVYVGLGVYLGTFKYLALAVVVAPLMLFRIEFSADWGGQVYSRFINRYADRTEKVKGWLGFVYYLALFDLVPLAGTAIRFISTAYWLLRRPLQTFRDSPGNWLRQALCMDFAHPPEIVPKEALASDRNIPTFTHGAISGGAHGRLAVYQQTPLLTDLRRRMGSIYYLPSFFQGDGACLRAVRLGGACYAAESIRRHAACLMTVTLLIIYRAAAFAGS